MITGSTLYGTHSQVVVNTIISDKVKVESVTSLGFKQLIPMVMPKGPTNRVFAVAGSDTVNKFTETFGYPHTKRYGLPGTYAYEAVRNGWTVYCVNLRPDDATYANVVMDFVVEPTERAFVVMPAGAAPNNYRRILTFANEAAIPEEISTTPAVVIGTYNAYNIGFKDSYLANMLDDSTFRDDLDALCKAPAPTMGSSGFNPNFTFKMPIFGFLYQGAGEYANGYTVSIQETIESLSEGSNTYPLYKMTLLEGSSVLFNSTTCLTRLLKDDLPVAPDDIFDRYTKYYVTGYLAEAKYINRITSVATEAIDASTTSLANAIKAAIPTIDLTMEGDTDFYLVGMSDDIAKQELALENNSAYGDHALSTFKYLHKPISEDTTSFGYLVSNGAHKLDGGSYGCINDILKTDGFDWNAECITITDTTAVEDVITVYNSPTLHNSIKVKLNSDRYEAVYFKPFTKMFEDFYNLAITKEIVDPAMMPSALILDPDYPNSVKKAAAQFNNVPSYYQSISRRPDVTYVMASPANLKNAAEIAEWSRGYSDENRNVFKVAGRTQFTDPSTNRPEMFSGIFSFHTTLLPHLLKIDGNSFSGANSAIFNSNIVDKWTGLPSDVDDRNLYAKSCLNYFSYYTSLNAYALDDDCTNIPDFETSVKRLVNNTMFNEVVWIAYMYLRENKISKATPVEWSRHEQAILSKISAYRPAFNSLDVAIGYDSTTPSDVVNGIPSCFLTCAFDKITRHFKLVAEVVAPAADE